MNRMFDSFLCEILSSPFIKSNKLYKCNVIIYPKVLIEHNITLYTGYTQKHLYNELNNTLILLFL